MFDDSSATVPLLGLDGFRLLSVSDAYGELELAVETTAEESFCRACGVRAAAHGRRLTWVRDLPIGGRPTCLLWVKRLWRCREPLCPSGTWSETNAGVQPRAALTERARAEVCRRVGEDGHPVSQLAAEFGVSWGTAMAAVRDHGRPRIDDPDRLERVAAVGVDETAFLAANARCSTQFVTGVVDLTGDRARLLDVVAGRSGTALSGWLAEQTDQWRGQIAVAALDPFRGYATALRTGLPTARRVLDAFHVVRLGFAAVDEVRRRIQQQTLGRRGHKNDPLYRTRRLLRRGADTLSPTAWDRLLTGLEVGDPDGQVGQAWIVAQELRLLFRAPDRDRAERRLFTILCRCADADVPELHRLARTLDGWREELLAYFDTGGVSNGPTEATNALIKKIKRIGHGFRNFTNYRLRLLLYCGTTWNTPAATPLRGRAPRLNA